MKAWLEMPDGVKVDVGTNCQIGRVAGSAIRIDAAEVSRRHAFIHVQQSENGTEYWLADLGSTNGTIRNGRRITIPCRLYEGDTISFGETHLKFHQSDATEDQFSGDQAATTIALQTSRYCWLLMVDIKSFTQITHSMSPEALGRMVGTWLRRTRDAVESVGGIVDKFLGDAIFAYWEAGPESARTVASVLGTLQAMQGEKAPDFRIVVHFGPALLAGAIGGANNVSGLEVIYVFRMEKIGSQARVDTVVSEAARKALGPLVGVESIGSHKLDGFPGEHELFHLAAAAPATERRQP